MAKKAPKKTDVELLDHLLELFDMHTGPKHYSGICAVVWSCVEDQKDKDRLIKMIKDCSPYKNEHFEDMKEKETGRKGEHYYWLPMSWANATNHETEIRRVFIERMREYYEQQIT